LLRRHRFRPAEALPWLIAIAVYFIFPTHDFGSQVLVMVMVRALARLSSAMRHRDLGTRPFFGIGAYTGLGAAALDGPSRSAACLPRPSCRHFSDFFRAVPVALSRLDAADVTLATRDHVAGGWQPALDFSGGYDGLPGPNSSRCSVCSNTTLRPRQLHLCVDSLAWCSLCAAHRLFAVRAGAHRHSRERAAQACIGSPVHRRLVTV